jgi:hypothetical protein
LIPLVITSGLFHVAAPSGTITVSPGFALEIAALMSAKEGLAAVTVFGVSGAWLAWQYWDEPVKRQ